MHEVTVTFKVRGGTVTISAEAEGPYGYFGPEHEPVSRVDHTVARRMAGPKRQQVESEPEAEA